MLTDALEGECVFAVGRMEEGAERPKIGTAGLVRASKENKDGTSQLLLHGVIRVRFSEWLEDDPYPCAEIDPITCEGLKEGQSEAAVKTLRGSVEDAIQELAPDVRAGVLGLLDEADDPALMSDLVAQQFVHDADLREELLQTVRVGERVRMLCEFFQKL